MSRSLFVAVLVSSWVVGAARADEEARALAARAVKAAGGEAVLAKFPASVAKIKGTFHQEGTAVPVTGTVSVQGADQLKIEIDVTVSGEKLTIVHVLNRDKGWAKVDGTVEEVDQEELKEMRHEAYAAWLTSLVPLKDKALTLSPLGEVKVNDRPAVGLKVTSKDRRDVNLFFDKETALLVKSETQVVDEDTQKEMTEVSYFTDYKEVQGVKTAMKFRTTRDGKPHLDVEVAEITYHEKLGDDVFGRP